MKNLYWKIQTLPFTDNFNTETEEYEMYVNKYSEFIKEQRVEEHFYDNAGKNPLFSRIYSLSIGFYDEQSNSIRVKVFKGQEKSILQSFLNTCNSDFFKGFKITGYNLPFLLPTLRTRMLKNGMKLNLPEGLVDIGKKPWTLDAVDLADMYSGIGWFKNSLEELAYICNVELNAVDGKDVYFYYKEKLDIELETSIINETAALINCHRVITGEEVCSEVSSTVELVGEVEEKELPLLQKLHASKQFNEEVKQYLRDAKINKKDIPTVKKIILAHYREKVDVMAQNKKELKEINDKRTAEVNEFFKTY